MMSNQRLTGNMQFTPDQDESGIDITPSEEGVRRMVEWNDKIPVIIPEKNELKTSPGQNHDDDNKSSKFIFKRYLIHIILKI